MNSITHYLILPAMMLLCYQASAAQGTSKAESLVIDRCEYAEERSAQAAWQPMGGSAPVSVAKNEGRDVLRFPCLFSGNKVQRASWDQRIAVDLSSAAGVQFRVLCRDASPVSYFSIYFQSGDGWYHGAFYPESSAGWNTIFIKKSEMVTEGRPAGWKQIRAIRISAWRSKETNTEFYFKDLCKAGVLGADASVAILRCESGIRAAGGEKRSIEQFTGTVSEWMLEYGVGCTVLSDLEIAANSLEKAKLVILPYNPGIPEGALQELSRYVQKGGKLLAMYSVPELLRNSLNILGGEHIKAPRPGAFATIHFREGLMPGAPPEVAQQSWNISAFQPVTGKCQVLAEWLDTEGKPTGYPAVLGSSNSLVMTHVLLRDDPEKKKRMLLAMAGWLLPEIWKQAAEAEIENISDISEFQSYDQAVARISQLGRNNSSVQSALASSQELRTSAIKLLSQQRYPESLEKGGSARDQLMRAFCMAQTPQPGEFRGFWCHSAFGVLGLNWDEAIGRLARNGFSAVIPNMLWGGAAFYPSKVLPVVPQVAERGDQIKECLNACRKYGVQVHVWKVNWNLGQAAPETFVQEMHREQRLQASSTGQEQRWLCPSRPENQKLEIDSMVEIARKYDVDGLHFDYIRYPDGEHCFCAGCRERFQAGSSRKVRSWPEDVLEGGALRQPWLDWRRSNITKVVKAVSEQVRAIRPKMKISAAVFSNWAADRDGVGQDWKLWCEKGYVDFVCPMDYTSSNRSFENMLVKQKEWAGRTPFYPGIGYSASTSHFGIDRAIDQINLTRSHNTGGFVIFNYGVSESQELLPMLGLGTTSAERDKRGRSGESR